MDQATLSSLSMDNAQAFLNWSLAAIFLFLRVRGGKGTMTMSQKWALTCLSWLFILNSISISLDFGQYLYASGNYAGYFSLINVKNDIDVMISFTLLIVGLVYPRPFTTWNRLRIILMALLLAMFSLVLLQVQLNQTMNQTQSLYNDANVSHLTYILGWFVPVLIWLPLYEAETSQSSRMVLTLFIWAFMLTVFITNTARFMLIVEGKQDFTVLAFLSLTVYFYIMARLVFALYKRRAVWERPEWINATFLCASAFLGLFKMAFASDPIASNNNATVIFITSNIPWTILRPCLFAFAILKFQIFGPQVRVERYLAMILGVLGSMAAFILISYIPGLDLTMLAVIGILVGILLFMPFLRLSDRVIIEFLPMTSKEERTTMVAKRFTYMTSLQTAVVGGAIDLPEDEDALAQQRVMLGISQREHDLLMESFMAREALSVKVVPVVTEVFLIHIDGRALAHETVKATDGKVRAPEKDSDIMAGMLTAIQDYVREGLAQGGMARTSLDAIKYGDYSLVIETEEQLVLAAVVNGPDSPELRQAMRDELTLIKKRYGKDLMRWDGDMDKTVAAQSDLRSFIDAQSHRTVRA